MKKNGSFERSGDILRRTIEENVLKISTTYGFKWGGNFTNFKDYPHFEKTFGLHHTKLKEKLEKGICDGHYPIIELDT